MDYLQFYTAKNAVTGEHRGLFRWARDNGRAILLLERLDPESHVWTDWPDLFRASGIGGDSSYEQIEPREAQRIAGPGINIWPDDHPGNA